MSSTSFGCQHYEKVIEYRMMLTSYKCINGYFCSICCTYIQGEHQLVSRRGVSCMWLLSHATPPSRRRQRMEYSYACKLSFVDLAYDFEDWRNQLLQSLRQKHMKVPFTWQ
uniref:AlNc14C67G4736 protein n=1 Tax=Albugo laibachii Nc14 TaxID=890382 RepID=F0WDL6_9STRA|nr:AlNc14C67G4736 [Albugo laibachii Nc14]|eukprot:CCA19291.1 AlNc14C67G4736 [Albugo laibachii Nc14]